MLVSADPDDVLVAYGLGSCVAICLYDSSARVGGMLHALLPTSAKNGRLTSNPAKFVEQGLPLLIAALTALGARHTHLAACLCGGAQVLAMPGLNGRLKVGQLNIQAARLALQAARIELRAQAVGGHSGRTVKLYLTNGEVIVKKLGQPEQTLPMAR